MFSASHAMIEADLDDPEIEITDTEWPLLQPDEAAPLIRVPQVRSLWDVIHELLDVPARCLGRTGIRVFAGDEALAEFTVQDGAILLPVSLAGRPFVEADVDPGARQDPHRPLRRLCARALLAVARQVGLRPFELRPCPPSSTAGPRFLPMELLLQMGRACSDGILDAAGRLFAALQHEADDAWLLCHRLPDRCLPLPLGVTGARSRDLGYASAVVHLSQRVLGFLRETGNTAGEFQDFLAAERRLFGQDERFLRLAFDAQPPLVAFWHEDGCWCALAGPTHLCLVRCPATQLGRVQAAYRAQLDRALRAQRDSESSEEACLAAGYVDMATGALLSVKAIDAHPPEVVDLVASATADLFQGSSVSTVERHYRRHRGITDDGHHSFQEMFLFSDHLTHAFLRCKKNTDHALVFVCRKGANLSRVLSRARTSLPNLEGAR